MNLSKKLDEMLTSRWILWFISVASAASMWYFIIGAAAPALETREFLVPIEFLNLQPQTTVKSTAREARIEIEAVEGVINTLAYDTIICEVNLNGLPPGKYRPTLRPTLPPDVTLKSVVPSVLDLELVRQVARVLPVEVTLPQDIPAGYYLEAVEVVPREINIKGTESDVAKIGSVNIAPTFLELQTGKELLLPVSVNQSQPFEDDVVLEPQQVKINAVLTAGVPRKRVPVNVRLLGKPHGDYEVASMTTDPAEVMVQGEASKLEAVSAADTEAVDITNITADQTIVVPLRAFADEGVSAVSVSSVKLSIHLEPIAAQRLVSSVPVAVNGAAAGTAWSVDPPAVTLTVEALPSVMAAADLDTLELGAFADVSGIFLRRAELPVWPTLSGPGSENFKVVRIDPSMVTVSVTED